MHTSLASVPDVCEPVWNHSQGVSVDPYAGAPITLTIHSPMQREHVNFVGFFFGLTVFSLGAAILLAVWL